MRTKMIRLGTSDSLSLGQYGCLLLLICLLSIVIASCDSGKMSDAEANALLTKYQKYMAAKYDPSKYKKYAVMMAIPVPDIGLLPRDGDIFLTDLQRENLKSFFARHESTLIKLYGSAQKPKEMAKAPERIPLAQFIKVNRILLYRSMLAISENNFTEAAKCLDIALQLTILLYPRDYWCALTGGSNLQTILNLYEEMIWLEIPPGAARQALINLNAIEHIMHNADIADAWLGYALLLINNKEFRSASASANWIKSDFPLAEMVGGEPNSLSNLFWANEGKFLARFFRDESNKKYVRLTSNHLKQRPLRRMQISFHPAFQKRIRQWTRQEPVYFANPVISQEELLKMPLQIAFFLQMKNIAGDMSGNRAQLGEIVRKYEQIRLALAARLYRADTGTDPESVADLVPKYLPQTRNSSILGFALTNDWRNIPLIPLLLSRALPRSPYFRIPNGKLHYDASGNTVTLFVDNFGGTEKAAGGIEPQEVADRLKRYSGIVESATLLDPEIINNNRKNFIYFLRLREELHPLAIIPKQYRPTSPREWVTLAHF